MHRHGWAWVVGALLAAAACSDAQDAQDTIPLRDNPHAERPGAPPRVAYAPLRGTIVQLGADALVPYTLSGAPLDRARMLTPWEIKEGTPEALNQIEYRDDQGRRVAGRHDLRGVPANRHGLPDFGTADLARVKAGERELMAQILAGTSIDPDWHRWNAGRYEIVAEYEEGRSIGLRVIGLKARSAERAGRVRLGDGYVRETWHVDARDGVHAIYVKVGEGADARDWRRLSIYQTHAYDEKTGDRLVPTNARALHEAGQVWSPRHLGLFSTRYNAVRTMDLGQANLSDELAWGERNTLADQGTWALRMISLPYRHKPWDAVRHLRGNHRAGVPLEAMLRLAYEASLDARARGAAGHVVNPHLLMPFRFTGEDVDRWLDAVAAHVRWAEANGVAYDYVKVGVYNEPWNSAVGAFREAHAHAAAAPASFEAYTNAAAPGYRPPPAAPPAPWYATPAALARWDGIDSAAAQKGAARRLIHLLSRAYARHPDISWIGEHSAQSHARGHGVRLAFEGARDGAADVEAWAVEGDPYTGSTQYAFVPRDAEGRHAVGALFAYSLTTYWYLLGGPEKQWLGGLPPEEVVRLAEEGTLNATLAERFLTLPAEPTGPDDQYGPTSSLAGMRGIYADVAAAAAEEGGVMLDFYEGGNHTTRNGRWPDAVTNAYYRFLASEEAASIQDAIHDAALAEGFVGVTDFVMTGRDQHGDRPFPFAPWQEELDPYTTEPWEALWAKRLGPLPPPGDPAN